MRLPIDDDGIRPAGPEDRCFYCAQPKGTHNKDCVCVKKLVVLSMTIEYCVDVPAFWDKRMIEFQRNEGSFCMGNDIEQLSEEDNIDDYNCFTCQRVKTVDYLRDANDEDVERLWGSNPTRRPN